MSMKLKMGLKMQQTLRMTPQLQQAIKLLQMSRMELENEVMKELEENPLLEDNPEGPEEELPELEGDTELKVEAEEQSQEHTPSELADDQNPQKIEEFEWENFVDQAPPKMQNLAGGNEEIMNYENIISTSQTLFDHLMWQAHMSGFSDEEKMLAAILIANIDDEGYIKTPLDQIAQDEGVKVEDLESVLPYIHEFDPPGVGARDLQECLLVQAKHLQEDTKDMVHIIKNHLRDLEKKNYEGIAKTMNMPFENVVEICKIIYAMDPKPGRAYQQNDTQYVTPDVHVYQVGDDYIVSVNEDGLPRLRISNFYKNVMAGGKENNVTQDYIQEKLRSAVWLIKSIHQRQRTIYRVTQAIVKYQRDFFDKGPEHLRPMILKDIAEEVGLHESTISRVTTSKYMHTPRGIFELKHFFNSGLNRNDGGEALASESVRLKIKDMIAKENPKAPLSDQKIVEVLQKDGIEIARRTVAKYREAMGVLPSSKRKKYF